MAVQTSAVSPKAAPLYHPRRWPAAIVMTVAALMDMIDVTIVNVALPTIRRDLVGRSRRSVFFVNVPVALLSLGAAAVTDAEVESGGEVS
jgi:hypothetical protein